MRILYIDDDKHLCELSKTVIEACGHSVDVACNGSEGLTLHAAQPYDLLAIDQQLPDMSGIGIAQKLLLDDPGIAIVMVVSSGSEQVACEALSLGVYNYVVKDSEKHFLKLLPMIIDSVLKKAAERNDRESAANSLRQAIGNMPGGFAYFGPDDRCVVVNNKMLEIYPLVADLLVPGVAWETLMRTGVERRQWGPENEPDRERWMRETSAYHADPKGAHELNIPDGRVISIEEIKMPDGGTVSVRTDITGLKKIERQHRESESRYEQASRIASLGHWDYDEVADKSLFCSDELARIHGVSPDAYVAMISSTEKDIERVHPDDRQTYGEVLRRAQSDAAVYEVEYRIIRPTGEVRHIREIGEPICDQTGKLIKSRGTIQDITERVQLEEQLRHSQRMEAVGQLTGGVAHDFNNLLAVMIGNSEMLKDKIGDDESARHQLDAISRAVDRASSLTDRLLAFSRQQSLSPVVTDVPDLIDGLVKLLRRTLGETIDLRVAPGPGLWLATIDAHQFENALVNLSLNARDAMPSGGTLIIETANVTLDDNYAAQNKEVTPGDYVKVAVSDTGTGMTPDVMEKVFEPFFTTKEVGRGSGLGLSMVYGFAKQSGGHIAIYSEVGHGTTVNLYMPRSSQAVAQVESGHDTPKLVRGSERILIVEDDDYVRQVPVNILQDQGYEIVEAADGKQAIRHLMEGRPFELLFTDVMLPGGMNGVEIADQAVRIQPNIKVLFTSGYAENALDRYGQLESDTTLISKPYRRAELLVKVRDALESKGG